MFFTVDISWHRWNCVQTACVGSGSRANRSRAERQFSTTFPWPSRLNCEYHRPSFEGDGKCPRNNIAAAFCDRQGHKCVAIRELFFLVLHEQTIVKAVELSA